MDSQRGQLLINLDLKSMAAAVLEQRAGSTKLAMAIFQHGLPNCFVTEMLEESGDTDELESTWGKHLMAKVRWRCLGVQENNRRPSRTRSFKCGGGVRPGCWHEVVKRRRPINLRSDLQVGQFRPHAVQKFLAYHRLTGLGLSPDYQQTLKGQKDGLSCLSNKARSSIGHSIAIAPAYPVSKAIEPLCR